MNITLIKKTDKELKFEVKGESSTLLNVLQKNLLEDEDVEIVGWTSPHRLIGSPVFYVKTKGKKSPIEAIIKASETIEEDVEEFKKRLMEAFKEYEKGSG
ncbi:MAG: DNA-directed RNA polymerase subunit L [Candidatus Bathyarchaeota archaeon]|nr:DNA-directed RNA polymerase subunit L [Candidatus Bathyarchaeota archaeon]